MLLLMSCTLFPYTTLFRSNSDQLSSELYIIGSYGLRNKRELWKAQTKVANFRNQARTLLALTLEDRQEKESLLLSLDRKSTRLNSSHLVISYAVFCLKKKI